MGPKKPPDEVDQSPQWTVPTRGLIHPSCVWLDMPTCDVTRSDTGTPASRPGPASSVRGDGRDAAVPDFEEDGDDAEDDRADHGVREAPHVAEDLTQDHQRLQRRPAAEHGQTVLGLRTE